MRLLAVGLDCEFDESDKNFGLELLGRAAQHLEHITLLSVETGRGRGQRQPDGIEVRRVQRAAAGIYEPGWTLWRRTRLLASLAPEIETLLHERHLDTVHLLDNFGPGLQWLRRRLPRRPITVPALMFKAPRMYPLYMRLSLGAADRVVVPNREFRDRLLRVGLQPGRLEMIRWGVPRQVTDNGVADRAPHLLWSGFLQFQNESDLQLAAEVTRRAQARCPELRATFAFKSHHYRPEFARLAGPRIEVCRGRQAFETACSRATVFLSPMVQRRIVVAPPLTWIEMQAHGIPVVTSPVPGSAELVQDGVTGFRRAALEDLVDAVVLLASDRRAWEDMSRRARERVRHAFTLESAVRRYVEMWRSLHAD